MSIVRIGFLGCAAAAFVACGDDVTLGPDSGPPKSDATIDQGPPPMFDASIDASSRLLMTYAATSGELAAFNVTTGSVDGRLSVPGYAVVKKSGGDIFLLETGKDLVVRLDPATQWQPLASWNVTGSDGVDGGLNADPVDIVETASNKAYVLRYNRNAIAVIDPSQSADAGAPTGMIDLSAFLQTGNTDGAVEATAAVYDPGNKYLYVALSNIDTNNVIDNGTYQLCGTTVSTVVAIDTTSDTVVNLSDAGFGGGIPLHGVATQNGYYGGMALDVVGHRILVLSTGCNELAGDGGVGATTGRLIEAVDLTSNTSQTLLDLNSQPYPGVFTYIDGAHALVQVGFFNPKTFQWIPTESTLGPALPTTPDLFDYDGVNQRILGPQQTYVDGGLGPMNVIAVPIAADAGLTVLGQNPFTQTGGYEGNVVYVP